MDMRASDEMIWPTEEDADQVARSVIEKMRSFVPVDSCDRVRWRDPAQMTIGERLRVRVRSVLYRETVEGPALTVLAAAFLSDICAAYCGHACGKKVQHMIDFEECGIQIEISRLKLNLTPYIDKTIEEIDSQS